MNNEVGNINEQSGLREIERVAKITELMKTKVYQELKEREDFEKIFDRLLSKNRLLTYSDEVVDMIIDSIGYIPGTIDCLKRSLWFGSAPLLTTKDKPNFAKKETMINLIDKLSLETGENYTNLQPNEYMVIFDDETIKSIDGYYYALPKDCQEEYGHEIKKLLGNKKYCISKAEVLLKEKEYFGEINELCNSIENIPAAKWKHRFFKTIVGITVVVFPSILNGLTGCFTNGILTACTVFLLVLTIVYWIKG